MEIAESSVIRGAERLKIDRHVRSSNASRRNHKKAGANAPTEMVARYSVRLGSRSMLSCRRTDHAARNRNTSAALWLARRDRLANQTQNDKLKLVMGITNPSTGCIQSWVPVFLASVKAIVLL